MSEWSSGVWSDDDWPSDSDAAWLGEWPENIDFDKVFDAPDEPDNFEAAIDDDEEGNFEDVSFLTQVVAKLEDEGWEIEEVLPAGTFTAEYEAQGGDAWFEANYAPPEGYDSWEAVHAEENIEMQIEEMNTPEHFSGIVNDNDDPLTFGNQDLNPDE